MASNEVFTERTSSVQSNPSQGDESVHPFHLKSSEKESIRSTAQSFTLSLGATGCGASTLDRRRQEASW